MGNRGQTISGVGKYGKMSMNANTESDTDDASPAEQKSAQEKHIEKIETIQADPDEIIKHYRKNIELDGTLYTPRSFQVRGIRSDGPCTLDAGVDPRDENETARYPDAPHAVWISPRSFIEGAGYYEESHPANGCEFPDRGQVRSQTRDAVDYEVSDEEYRRDGDATNDRFEEDVEETYEITEQMWRDAVEKNLKDEITLGEHKHGDWSHTVQVEWVDEESDA